MPIAALILSTLALWTIYWFVRMGGIDHFRAKQAQRNEADRLAKAQAAARDAPLRAVDDPRNAAMILMLLIPRGRDPTESQIALIEEAMHGVFEFGHDAHEHLTQAQFMAGRAQSFAQAAGIFANMFNTRLTADERRQLVGLVEKVALIDGPSAAQTADIDALKRMVGVAPL